LTFIQIKKSEIKMIRQLSFFAKKKNIDMDLIFGDFG
jgi:hypothetical protein